MKIHKILENKRKKTYRMNPYGGPRHSGEKILRYILENYNLALFGCALYKGYRIL
jgi:hypothetical protein